MGFHVASLAEWFMILLFYLRDVHVAESQEFSHQPFPVSWLILPSCGRVLINSLKGTFLLYHERRIKAAYV